MGIFKKIFGKNEDKPAFEKSPLQQREAEQVKASQSRAPRVVLTALHNIGFKIEGPGQGTLKLANLSETGIGFVKSGLEEWPPVGSELKGVLIHDEHAIPVVAKIVHTTGRVVGCAFTDDQQNVRAVVSRYFDLEISAMKLVEVNSELLQEQPDGTARWFRGADNCELYFVESEKRILRFNLSFFGHYIDYDEDQVLRVGEIVADQVKDKARYKGADLVHFGSEVRTDTVAQAVKFIGNIELLTMDQRNYFCDALTGASQRT